LRTYFIPVFIDKGYPIFIFTPTSRQDSKIGFGNNQFLIPHLYKKGVAFLGGRVEY
jgi:hypothetical protein